ncbi:sodium- and chloride-dependent glycine transporter 1-like [Argopecten irradians]|uniref:sodium- and chloride-dependent glycine transporter 1-like n=1 Tax=Argopecten irradians TaxID=31199 RepID=UPI0037161533
MRSWIIEYLVNSFQAELPWTSCNNTWNTENCITGFHQSPNNRNISSHSSSTGNPLSKNVTLITSSPVSAIEEFWMKKVLRRSSGIEDIGEVNGMYILYYIVVRVIVFLACVKSVKSLGKVMYVTAILPVVLVILIWVRALFLPGATEGMLYFITPDFTKLGNIEVWIEAAFMTFYTLGPGWGGLMMMGCHNHFRTNCLRAAVSTTVATLLYGLLNGLVVFSVLGVMASEANVPITDAVTSGGFSIGFIAYPKALSYFPLPQVWCVLFFVTLLLPGIDAMTIETEPVMLILEENFPSFLHNKRPWLLGGFSVLALLLSIPFATKAGVYMFQLVDWYLATWSIMLICIGESIVFFWIYGGDKIDRDIQLMLGRPLPALIRFSCAFIMPMFLLFLLVVSVYTYRPPTLGSYTYPTYATAIGWCFSLASVVPIILYAVRIIITQKGSLKKRLRISTTPTTEWGPACRDVTIPLLKTDRSLSFRELVLFNFYGNRDNTHLRITTENDSKPNDAL